MPVKAQDADSIRSYWLTPIEVTAEKTKWSEAEFPTERDNFENILNRGGFELVRRGVFFAQDIYSEGFKRADINVVVDGERYHSACPNRMDSPLTRVNPLEMEKLDMVKSALAQQAGLSGVLSFYREKPKDELRIKSALSGSAAAQQSIDGAMSIEKNNNRLSLRYATGLPYDDADGESFESLYGYEKNFAYQLAEVSYMGKQNDWEYGTAFSYTDNVSFPYLRMDERVNRVYSSFLSYKDNKIYFNYTDHVMDNDLRVSPMFMESAARNFTLGAVGRYYEVVYRRWDANNIMITPMMSISNHMVPNVSNITATLYDKIELDDFTLSGKIGLAHFSLGDEDRKSFYEQLYTDAETSRFFGTFALGAGYSSLINDEIGYGVLLEAASVAPETETMFIAVKKPMGNPAWVGNPAIDQPVRSTLRTSVNYETLRLEAFGTYVWNYVNLENAAAGGSKFLTYQNVDALLSGLSVHGAWRYYEFNAAYTWAENKTNSTPLAEIAPLSVTSKIILPEVLGVKTVIRHTYNDAQTRVDENLNESATPAWNRFDIKLVYAWNKIKLSLDIGNVTNERYHRHLSYLRDPFASGVNVYDPGRSVRLNILYDSGI